MRLLYRPRTNIMCGWLAAWSTHSLTHPRVRRPPCKLSPLLFVVAATMAICFYCFPDKIFSTDAIPKLQVVKSIARVPIYALAWSNWLNGKSDSHGRSNTETGNVLHELELSGHKLGHSIRPSQQISSVRVRRRANGYCFFPLNLLLLRPPILKKRRTFQE